MKKNVFLVKFVFACLVVLAAQLPLFAEFDNTNVLVEKAVNDIYQKRYKEAHQTLKTAYEQSPRHPGVHFNLGRLFELTGNFSEALKEYQIAVYLDPTLISARRGIARCGVELKRMRNYPAPVESSPKIAISKAPFVTQAAPEPVQPKVLTVSPQKKPTEFGLPSLPPQLPEISTGGKTGSFGIDEVQPQLSAATNAPTPVLSLPAMPRSPELPAVEEIRVPPIPVEISNKVQEKRKSATQIQAENFIDRGDASRAIQVLQTGEPDSDDPNVLFLTGKANAMRGDLFAAIKNLEEAIRVDDKFYEAYYLLAQNYSKVNLLDDAIKNYLVYFGVKPQAGVAVEIAKTYERMGKPELAREFYAKANSMNPGNPNLQAKLNQAQSKTADDLFLRGNHALTMGDYAGAVNLFSQAISAGGLGPMYQKDALRKIEIAKFRANEIEQIEKPAREGFTNTRKIYGTVNLKYSQLAGIDFHTRFIEPVTVEWRGFVAKKFRRYGRDFLLMIKELSQDELDEMGRDRNDYRLNPNYNNQPLFLVTAKIGELPAFIREGQFLTFTGRTDWKRYDVINELGQTVKLIAFDYVSGHP